MMFIYFYYFFKKVYAFQDSYNQEYQNTFFKEYFYVN